MGWTSARSLGVAFPGRDAAAHVAERAPIAEQAGFDSLWFIEDYFTMGAFALAGAAAAVTTRIGLGLGVVNPYTRHPALLAMESAALASVAPGRVVLGLGTGVRRWIEDQMGIPAARPLATLRDCVDVVRRLWAGERVTRDGRDFSLRDVALEWKPAQPHLPIVLGVKGPRALALAGAIADGVVCSIMSSPAHVRRVRETAGAARRRAGQTGPFPVAAYLPVAIDRDAAAARRSVRPLLAQYLAHLHGQMIVADAGVSEAETLAIRNQRARGESGAALVTEEHIDSFALAGTADHARRQLSRWVEAGLDVPIALPVGSADAGEQLGVIAAELGPWLRSLP
jgi:alkanesulfonate monooxygenase SsuD/methylene tetrahydromethanopterin reductase-like flavin-dependent oxidoreductase (luciferase family)